MCKTTREIKKEEAIKRMAMLGLFKPCIKAFNKYDEVQLTEPNGGLYEFSDNEELNAKIKEFEEEYEALVYHVIHSPMRIDYMTMDMYCFLYVSDYEEEWEMDETDIADGYVVAYVWNKSEDYLSEIGSIVVRERFCGLVRVG